MLANGKAVARQPVPCLEAAAGGPAQLFHCKAAGHNNKGPPQRSETHTYTDTHHTHKEHTHTQHQKFSALLALLLVLPVLQT